MGAQGRSPRTCLLYTSPTHFITVDLFPQETKTRIFKIERHCQSSDRKGKDSIAVEPFEVDWIKWPGTVKEGFDIIPMWVADMNFPAVY